jgi:hypothetical protein
MASSVRGTETDDRGLSPCRHEEETNVVVELLDKVNARQHADDAKASDAVAMLHFIV